MYSRSIYRASIIILLGTGSLNCQRLDIQRMAASENPHIQIHAQVVADAVWKRRDIPVCWENPSSSNKAGRDLVRQAVTESWQAASKLVFKGWVACAEENAGIRIQIADRSDLGPHTKGLGRQLNAKPNGMVLNFTFQHWSESCQQKVNYCIKTIAVHEFGHAIGFAHEQNRADAPGECQKLAQGPNGDLPLTPYDKDSVMNYCNEKYNNHGVLSALDKKAVAELYGSPN
jgi:hypothetical protein